MKICVHSQPCCGLGGTRPSPKTPKSHPHCEIQVLSHLLTALVTKGLSLPPTHPLTPGHLVLVWGQSFRAVTDKEMNTASSDSPREGWSSFYRSRVEWRLPEERRGMCRGLGTIARELQSNRKRKLWGLLQGRATGDDNMLYISLFKKSEVVFFWGYGFKKSRLTSSSLCTWGWP